MNHAVIATGSARTEWRGAGLMVLGLALGCGLGLALMTPHMAVAEPGSAAALSAAAAVGAPLRGAGGPLTHPIVGCRADGGQREAMTGLEAGIRAILADAERKGLTRAAVHVADVETCQWLELGRSDLFHPASLLKLPLAVAWMRHMANDEARLDRVLLYDPGGGSTMREAADDPSALKPGKMYSVRDLLRSMITESRNDAKYVLAQSLPLPEQDAVWRDLGLTPPTADRLSDVTVGDMATILRALYDGTLAGPTGSARLLEWMSAATYRDGLVARLPAGALVAHKFGRRVLPTTAPGQPTIQLHDCGILYRPPHPMAVCVMTEGQTEDVARSVIQKIALAAWTWQAPPITGP